MAQINIYSRYVISLPGQNPIEVGSASRPIAIDLDATNPDILVKRVAMPHPTVVTLLTVGSGQELEDFKALIIYASSEMVLAWQGSAHADTSVILLRAGTYWHLLSDQTKADEVDLSSRISPLNSPNQDITTFMVSNESASVDGYVQLWAVR